MEQRNSRGGTHSHAIRLILKDLANKYPKEFKQVHRYIYELKRLREKSDYSEDVIDQGIGFDAFNKANSILATIRRLYK